MQRIEEEVRIELPTQRRQLGLNAQGLGPLCLQRRVATAPTGSSCPGEPEHDGIEQHAQDGLPEDPGPDDLERCRETIHAVRDVENHRQIPQPCVGQRECEMRCEQRHRRLRRPLPPSPDRHHPETEDREPSHGVQRTDDGRCRGLRGRDAHQHGVEQDQR